MTQIRRSVPAALIFMVVVVLLSACTQSLSSAPAEAPTAIPTGLFVSPIASVENPMELIEQFAKQTEAAQTAVAGGGTPATTGTPNAGATFTTDPSALVASPTPTATIAVSTPTNANAAATTPVSAVTSAPPGTPVPAGAHPPTYTLQKGEWPWCVARRFNVDPYAMLQASGLTVAEGENLSAGTVLTIPASIGPFVGTRNLKAHPASYTVTSGDTVWGIACQYGDVDPNAIIAANNLGSNPDLAAGQVLQIP